MKKHGSPPDDFSLPDPLFDLVFQLAKRGIALLSNPSALLRPRILLSLAVLILVGVSIFGFRRSYLARHGLMGEYFYGTDFERLALKKRDYSVNFIWKRPKTSPLKKPRFSIRWTGFLKVDHEGDYEFSTVSDDGVRFYLGNTLLIDNWTHHSATTDSATLHLNPGLHAIKLEYFQGGKRARIQLYWRHENFGKKTIIGTKHLIPPEGV